ncbi:MAG: DAK2 domain-containing protein [Clostridia bacterium]|nr:DAK2 domain-containing protein [Clostridiales bacterium]MBQ3505184.1 DAK2 domain-containing protein [Clostridia bacterium]
MSNEKIINGEIFKRLLIGGASNLHTNMQEVNDLNVFPIPDGDTGDNMYLTLKGGLDELSAVSENSLCKEAKALAQGMLLNARGNSGVILSQLFYGLAEGLDGLETAEVKEFATALKQGVKCAYGAVAEPVEGTILTVAREAVEYTIEKLEKDMKLEDFFTLYLSEMKKSLERTPDLLKTLKEAGVIDSGGAGLVYIIEGFCKAFGAEVLDEEIAFTTSAQQKSVDLSKFNENSVMEFGYCTEFLLQLQHAKTDIAAFKVQDVIDFLSTVGDSIVAFQTGTIVKVHVHTMTPWKVLQFCQNYGEFLTLKIENMTLQHNETHDEPKKSTLKTHVQRARRDFAVVVVTTGEGLIATFKEMGADYVISGGQTNNPSSEEFICAFDEVNADHVFVLPNNSNVILAAKQAAEMYKDSDIRVIESKSVGEGYSALSMLDYGSGDADAIQTALTEAMQDVTTGMVTRAVRTTTLNGVDVTKDDYIGFVAHRMIVSTKEKLDAAYALTDDIAAGREFLIVAYGKDATEEERAAYAAYVSEKYADLEFYEIAGEQDVYDFLLIVE